MARTKGASRSSSRGWTNRLRSKSLMGHARTHPYATSAMAAAAVAGAGAWLWSRMSGPRQDMSAMAI